MDAKKNRGPPREPAEASARGGRDSQAAYFAAPASTAARSVALLRWL